MKIPILPTLIVAAAIAVMVGLGIWQLQRAEWKERLIAELRTTAKPRRVTLECAIDAAPEVRAGRNLAGDVGYRYLVPCRSRGSEVLVDLGWSKRPDAVGRLGRSGALTGMMQGGQDGTRRILVLDHAIPPLEASATPSAAEIPNNHLLYAVQWFFFASAAALIYFLALRRRIGRPDRG